MLSFGNPARRGAGRCVAPGTSCWTYDAVLRLLTDAGRKRRGSALTNSLAHARVLLSSESNCISLYKE